MLHIPDFFVIALTLINLCQYSQSYPSCVTLVLFGITVCDFLRLGHQGSISVSQGSEETIMEVSHQVHDVVPATRGAQDYHRWVWTGPDSHFTFSPALTNRFLHDCCCSLSPGHLHLLWLWEMGPEEEGGLYLWVQVPGRPRPAVTDGWMDGKRTETKRAAVDIPRLNFKLWIEIVMCSRNPLLKWRPASV